MKTTAIEILPGSTITKINFEIECLTKENLVNEHPELRNIDVGEWVLCHQDSLKQIVFCISAKWNENEIAHHFRLMAFKSQKHWPAAIVLKTDMKDDRLKSALRGLFMSSYTIKAIDGRAVKQIYLNDIADAKIIDTALAEAEAQMWVMEMVDLPPNKKVPEDLAGFARDSAKKYGYACEIWNKAHILNAGLNALYAVGRGSKNEPVFIICKYFGKEKTDTIDLALVGKGITFDSGGVSIKPSTNMHYMKSDMAGAGAMLGVIELAARLQVALNIAVVIPSAENCVDANSLLPGEIIESYSGKTIEVIDTDAEGRLVLSDALAWTAKNLHPAVMIDMATLTGSSIRALGNEAGALFSNNEALAEALFKSGLKTGEKLWRMPLWKDYDSYLHSDVADVANLSEKPIAGSISAAKFLEVFTNGHTAWAHIDMPGMSFKNSPFFKTKSATGYGVQILNDFIQKLADNADLVASK